MGASGNVADTTGNCKSGGSQRVSARAGIERKTARLRELNALLDMDKKENVLLDEAPDEGELKLERKKTCQSGRKCGIGNRHRNTYLSKYKIRESCI